MFSQLKPALKYFAILALVLAMGMSIWLIPRNVKKEKDPPITPPIDAKDEAGRYIQKASENFFYHEFDEAIENYKKAITVYEKDGKLKKAASKLSSSKLDGFKYDMIRKENSQDTYAGRFENCGGSIHNSKY